MAETTHYRMLRRDNLAVECRTSAGNLTRVVGSMSELKHALIVYAIEHDRTVVIAQAIIDKHPAVEQLSSEKRMAVMCDCAVRTV